MRCKLALVFLEEMLGGLFHMYCDGVFILEGKGYAEIAKVAVDDLNAKKTFSLLDKAERGGTAVAKVLCTRARTDLVGIPRLRETTAEIKSNAKIEAFFATLVFVGQNALVLEYVERYPLDSRGIWLGVEFLGADFFPEAAALAVRHTAQAQMRERLSECGVILRTFGQSLGFHASDDDVEEGADNELTKRGCALIVRGHGEEKIVLGEADGKLISHANEGKAALLGAPDLIAVSVMEHMVKR